jgi:hypothetical protein
MMCHLVTHHLAAQRPRLDFSVKTGEAHFVNTWIAWLGFHSVEVSAVNAKEMLLGADVTSS